MTIKIFIRRSRILELDIESVSRKIWNKSIDLLRVFHKSSFHCSRFTNLTLCSCSKTEFSILTKYPEKLKSEQKTIDTKFKITLLMFENGTAQTRPRNSNDESRRLFLVSQYSFPCTVKTIPNLKNNILWCKLYGCFSYGWAWINGKISW